MSQLIFQPFGRVLLPYKSMPHLVNLVKANDTLDDAGGRLVDLITVKKNVRCWVQDLSLQEQINPVAIVVVYTDKVVFLEDITPFVGSNDIIEFGNRLLRIKTIQDEANCNLVWTAMCETVT